MNTKPLMVVGLSSAGRRVELLRTLRSDAAALGRAAKMVAFDMAPEMSAACAAADVALRVPKCTAAAFTSSLAAACASNHVRLLIPTIDTELPALADAKQAMLAIGVRVIVSDAVAIRIARDKLLTAEVLAKAGVPVPATKRLAEALADRQALRFPAVLKHIDGSRSVGLHFADSHESMRAMQLDVSRYVIQERCIGPEYTVNCYVDTAGALRAAVPHRRIEVRDGEVSKGVTERRADLTAIAHKIVAAVPGLRGPFCFQAILTSEGPKVFEINARFGGGYPLAHAAGATFGKWLIEEALGLPCTANDEWQDGLLMLRYDAAVFIKQ